MKYKKIYVEITNKCNKRCSFCSIDNRVKHEMTIDEFKQVINKIKPYTNYIYLHVKGEPLIHTRFKEIIEICRKENMHVNITTNGTNLINQNKYLTNDVINQVNISIHALNIEEFKNITPEIEKLVNKKIHVVCRFWALENNKIDKDNMEKLLIILKYFNKMEILDEIKTKQNVKIQDYLYINLHNLFVWPNDSKTEIKYGSCYGLKTHIAILSNGTVVPCCLDSEGKINLGNIYEESLEDILNKERTKNIIEGFRQNKLVEELCKHCEINLIKNRLEK